MRKLTFSRGTRRVLFLLGGLAVLAIAFAATTGIFRPLFIPGRLVDVGSYSLHINCSGQGHPTVLLESGAGGNSLTWEKVQPEVVKLTRVCSYDRAGAGWSDRSPHNGQRVIEELHALLSNCGEAGPYVLVGHSLGGLYVRMFSAQHPQEVSGVVLIDATHEDQALRYPDQLPGIDPSLKEKLVRLHAVPTGGKPPLGDKPLIVVTQGRPSPEWKGLQEELTHLSANGRHIFAKRSGHEIPQDRPDVVVQAIRHALEATR